MKERLIKKFEDEIQTLNHELKLELPKEIKRARELGDLRENAEYQAAKERQRLVESRISMLQGVVNNPDLGTGLIAGYKTSGGSQRPGFAWYFGRDSMWTSFALTTSGDFANSRQALEHSQKAHQHTQEFAAHLGIKSFSHTEIAAVAYDLWAARGYPEGSADEDWFHAVEQLRSRNRSGS